MGELVGIGTWDLGAGTWVLGPGTWVLGTGTWVGHGCWDLGPGCCGNWDPKSRAQNLGPRSEYDYDHDQDYELRAQKPLSALWERASSLEPRLQSRLRITITTREHGPSTLNSQPIPGFVRYSRLAPGGGGRLAGRSRRRWPRRPPGPGSGRSAPSW